MSYQPAGHYDRVTAAWTRLLGHELHYGVFRQGDEELATATEELTRLMIEASRLDAGQELLDVGCGVGAPACLLAREIGVKVTGITTSPEGVRAARARANASGVERLVRFVERDGMDNGFPQASFDRVWSLESSHLMRDRDRLLSECARVLCPNGRLALCDIVLRRPMDFAEVRRLREPLALLREVFGDARMEPIAEYRRLAAAHGLRVVQELDLTESTRPTFARWRANAEHHREKVVDLLGQHGWQRFVDACDVLESFWDEGTLGYALFAATKG